MRCFEEELWQLCTPKSKLLNEVELIVKLIMELIMELVMELIVKLWVSPGLLLTR